MNSISLSSPALASFNPTLSGADPTRMSGDDPKELAQQFEGLFVSMLIKEMRQTSGPGEGMFPGDGSDTYGGMFDLYMGQHIAENGGIGLSESIAESIAKQSGVNDA